MDTTTILIIILAVVIIFFMAIAMKKINSTKKKEDVKEVTEPMPYKLAESIFTKSEKTLFEILKDYLKDKNLTILSKVRLADFVKIENSSNYQYWFNKIKSKHVDFLICENDNGKPILAIELDDYTHNQKSRKERDEFINQVYNKVKLPILHITDMNKENIYRSISQLI